jgi:hypothetical protein
VCGGPAPVGNCWCDEACVRWGDCCDDAWIVCGVGEPPAPEPEVDCDDGSSLSQFCDIKPPCDDGQVAAVINSCFQCVDALTCEPPAPEPEVDCDDGSSLHPLCDIKPPCDDGQVAAVINSCFQCVDALTCE